MAELRYQEADRTTVGDEDPGRAARDAPIWAGLSRAQLWLWIAAGLIIGLAFALRLAALDSDAYPRLSWSSALLTDEGFYIHNARNVVLFGTAQTDQFNNMLIMPTLHAV